MPDESDNRGTCSDFITRSCVVNVELNQSQARQTSRNGPLECGAWRHRVAQSQERAEANELGGMPDGEREREKAKRRVPLVGWLVAWVGWVAWVAWVAWVG